MNQQKNALFDSDEENINENNCNKNLFNGDFKTMFTNKTKQNRLKCACLTKSEIFMLEREFIIRKLKFNKSNVRKLAKSLNLPHKKSVEYFMNKVRQVSESLRKDRQIKKLKKIKKKLEASWKKFIDGCDYYNL